MGTSNQAAGMSGLDHHQSDVCHLHSVDARCDLSGGPRSADGPLRSATKPKGSWVVESVEAQLETAIWREAS